LQSGRGWEDGELMLRSGLQLETDKNPVQWPKGENSERSAGDKEIGDEEGGCFPCFHHCSRMMDQSPSRYVIHLLGNVPHIGPSLEHVADSALLKKCDEHEYEYVEGVVHEIAQPSLV
jgi:hypothetical protein